MATFTITVTAEAPYRDLVVEVAHDIEIGAEHYPGVQVLNISIKPNSDEQAAAQEADKQAEFEKAYATWEAEGYAAIEKEAKWREVNLRDLYSDEYK